GAVLFLPSPGRYRPSGQPDLALIIPVWSAAILADQLIDVLVLLVPFGTGQRPEAAVRHLETAVGGFIQRLLVFPCLLAVLFRLFFADAGLQCYRFAGRGFPEIGRASCRERVYVAVVASS